MEKQQKNNKKGGNKTANIGKVKHRKNNGPSRENSPNKTYRPTLDKTTKPPKTKSSKK